MASVALTQPGIGAAVALYSMIQAQNYVATIIVILNAVVTYAVVIEHTTVFLRFAAEEAKWIGDVVGKCNSYMYTPYEKATENTSFHIANILLIVYPLLSMKNLVLISET